ncbi:MAG: hypothetical protein DRP83_07980 [Planctomycetota bacterium]|nr:MAG: hypothetical protein DRP83_07980 [Planctomycetota bacterium]
MSKARIISACCPGDSRITSESRSADMRGCGLVLCALVSLFTIGCEYKAVSPQAREHLDIASRAYRAGDNRKTVAQADAALEYTGRGSVALQATYLRGMARYRLKDITRAQSDLEKVSRKSDNIQLLIRAFDALGEIAYRKGDMPRAEKCFQHVVDLADRRQRPVDRAHYRLGCILQRLGRWQQADVHFQRVIYLFGRSKLAKLSRRRVNGRKWTIQVGAYSTRSDAQAGAKAFDKAKLKTYIRPIVEAGRLSFLLQVGRWNKYERAAAGLRQARSVQAQAFLQVTR